MRAILMALLISAVVLIPGVTAIARQPAQMSTEGSCSTTGLFGQQGTFSVCVSDSTIHVDEPASITMTMTYSSTGLSCCLLYYGTILNISNNGTPVFSASDRCPLQWCTVASGQNHTVTFSWTTTPPLGVDKVQGALYWDFGCRRYGCEIASPLPAITRVNATIQGSPAGGEIVPTDKPALLASYMAVFLTMSVIAATLYLRCSSLRKTPDDQRQRDRVQRP